MKKLSLIFGLMLAWHGFLRVAQGQSNVVSTEKDGIRVEMWLENAEPRWDSLVVCCSVTNLRSTLYVLEVASGSGTPPLYVTMTSPQGLEVKLQDNLHGKSDFMPYGEDPFGIRVGRMFPGETLMARFKPTEYFRESNLGGCRLTAFWNSGFDPMTSPDLIKFGLALPLEPVVIQRPIPWRLEFTARELVRRNSYLDNGLQPEPPQSFKDLVESRKAALPAQETAGSALSADIKEEDSELWMQPMIIYQKKERLKSMFVGAVVVLIIGSLLGWLYKARRQTSSDKQAARQ